MINDHGDFCVSAQQQKASQLYKKPENILDLFFKLNCVQ